MLFLNLARAALRVGSFWRKRGMTVWIFEGFKSEKSILTLQYFVGVVMMGGLKETKEEKRSDVTESSALFQTFFSCLSDILNFTVMFSFVTCWECTTSIWGERHVFMHRPKMTLLKVNTSHKHGKHDKEHKHIFNLLPLVSVPLVQICVGCFNPCKPFL